MTDDACCVNSWVDSKEACSECYKKCGGLRSGCSSGSNILTFTPSISITYYLTHNGQIS